MEIGAGQSRKHLTGNAFALLDEYSDTEKSYTFIPCEMAFSCPVEFEDHKIVAKSWKLQFEFR